MTKPKRPPKGGYFDIANFGHTERWPCGYRSVFAVIGRTRVKLLDWASGEIANLDMRVWLSMQPTPRAKPKRSVLKRCAARANGRNKVRYKLAQRAQT